MILSSLGLLVVLTIHYNASPSDAVSCVDQEGRDVDWWILYKLPKVYKHVKHMKKRYRKYHKSKIDRLMFESNLSEGVAYAYLTSSMRDNSWTLSPVSINDPGSVPGRTLSRLYSGNTQDLVSILYNDEHPHGPTAFSGGHTKGLVLGDEISSLWLIHSVPHYPPYPNETYGYPGTGHLYGQSALCISVSSDQLNTIGRQLTYNAPYLYDTNHVPAWAQQHEDLVNAARGVHVKKAPYFNTEVITTNAGEKIISFAKYTKFGKDLYADLVAPSLQVPLLVETWPNGRGKLPSSCRGPFIVENVDEMNFKEIQDDDFMTTHDHSKWAISLDKKKPYVCIGDINRMDTQFRRGGGTACISSVSVWRTFKKSVKDIESC